MKKKNIYLLGLALLMLCGCGKKEEDLGDKYILGQDNQYYFEDVMPIAEDSDKYYWFGGNYLFSKDKKNGDLTILCDKPDCLHDEETDLTRRTYCNAYFQSAGKLQYYNGKIYVFETEQDKTGQSLNVIYEMDVSGSTREKIFEAKEHIMTLMIHRGDLYIGFSDFLDSPEVYEKNAEKRENSSYRVHRYSLDNMSKKPETVLEKSGEFGQPSTIWAYGNRVYINVAREGKSALNFVYNIQNKEVVEIPKAVSGRISIVGQQLIYFESFENDNGIPYAEYMKQHEGQKAIVADLDGNPTGTLDIPYRAGRLSNGELMVSDNWNDVLFGYAEGDERAIQIYDKDGKLVREVKLSGARTLPPLGISKDYYFYMKEPDANEPNASYEIWGVDLRRLNEENLEGEQLFAYVNPTGLSGIAH